MRVQPKIQIQMDTILKMTDGDVWLGMHRPQTSHIIYDIRYYSDGSRITYQNWEVNDPNNVAQKENCVMAYRDDNNKWVDISCTKRAGLICEL
ncbi:hypothetical protein LSH36_511g01123 [Paralvinella palmiformis]|uniref:C-type lectin domain-containing protein n=1 Tax=Paralvinella palmiformis TaxID=53620 RepID=A0AAD9J8E1_9ANNE|nr:hypothetical protein LSH36_511g01123 [Paralvinella palmiformis]